VWGLWVVWSVFVGFWCFFGVFYGKFGVFCGTLCWCMSVVGAWFVDSSLRGFVVWWSWLRCVF